MSLTFVWHLPAMELTGDEMLVLLRALSAMAEQRREEDPTTTPLSSQLYERFKARREWLPSDRKAVAK